MAIGRNRVDGQIRKRALEVDIAGKALAAGAHQRIGDVIANSADRAKADQFTRTQLTAIAAYLCVEWMILRQAQFRPTFCDVTRWPVRITHVGLESATIVEQVKLEQLETLVLEIEQRAVNAAAVRAEKTELSG
jgi:hypothetical protein